MKNFTFFTVCISIVLVIPINNTLAQTVSCEQLVKAVEAEATFYDEVGWTALLGSDFLEEVKAYEYEDVLFVIAKFKREPTQIFGKKYIFCGVPPANWRTFKNTYGGSYGERFHQYIMDYVCDCR